jgi:chorismate mutase
MWELPIALKIWFPNIPLICDPSHICGRRDLILDITQRSIDVGFDGIMIEVHENPDVALSDAKQQLTPDAFHEILNSLIIRKGDLSDPVIADQLLILRSKIDDIDDEIIRLIGSRMDVAEEIGCYKRDNDISVLQLKRWKEIKSTRSELADKLNLNSSFMDKFLEQIHKESIRKQTDILNNKNTTRNGVFW